MIRSLFSLASLALIFGCAAVSLAADEKPDSAELASSARRVLRFHCLRCHNGPGSEGGDFNMLSVDELLQGELLVPGKPEESLLLQRIEKAEMPPPPARLFADEAHVIRAWITAGAPKFPALEANRPHISLEKVLTNVRDYLHHRDHRAQAPFLRFFTLHNLANDPRILEEDLRMYRAALSKVVNSLSYKNSIKVPQAIDAEKTLFVIDLRDYDWDRTLGWEHAMRAYPYGLSYRNARNENLQALNEEIEELSTCYIPLLRADWFITTATRPELYHEILQIPNTALELEKTLGVDIRANFLSPTPERIARAGFPKSGVSGQNRLVERHDAKYGYYWKSYDFKADSARVKLTRFPLGPLNLFEADKHPFAAQAFIHDGGEIIFSLPNGLQAYMLISGDDKRIAVGPIEVVGDAKKTSGTYSIVNGVSCMSCHKNGTIPFADTVRQGNSLFGEPEKQTKLLYPEQTTMDRLIKQDKDRFMAALEKAMSPFLLPKEARGAGLENLEDPVGELSRLYRLGFLDLKTVACEVDVEDPQELINRVGEKKLKLLGLESLKSGGVVSRLEWEALDGVSLMQALARELQFTPISAE